MRIMNDEKADTTGQILHETTNSVSQDDSFRSKND